MLFMFMVRANQQQDSVGQRRGRPEPRRSTTAQKPFAVGRREDAVFSGPRNDRRPGLHDSDVRRLLAVWLEVVALAARGDAVFSSTARAVVEEWVAWVGERIDVPDEQRRSAAAGVLVIVDGLVLLGAAGADEEAAAGAAWLLDSLTSTGPA